MHMMHLAMAFTLLTAGCGSSSDHVASVSTATQHDTLDSAKLFYPFELNLLATPIRFRPDYDSGVDFSIEYSAVLENQPPVIRTFYSNSRGFRAETLLNLWTGTLTTTETQMGHTQREELLPPQITIRTKAAYLQRLDKLKKDVIAIRDGAGIDHNPRHEVALAATYLAKVRESAASAYGPLPHTDLFYPSALATLPSKLSYQPDYDSRVTLAVDYVAIGNTMVPVIETVYDNSKGFRSTIKFDLMSGLLRLEEGAIRNITIEELPAPALEATTKPAYTKLLLRLMTQVKAMERGEGVYAVAHPELAQVSKYLDAVMASL